MATVSDVMNNLSSLNIEEMIQDIVKDDSGTLLDIQKEQLMAGQDNEGNPLTPSYRDDPFFKTLEAAQRYSDWKDRITPPTGTRAYSERPKGTPNLFINGYWQSGIKFIPENGLFENDNPLNTEIKPKYPSSLGLNPDGIKYYRDFYFDEKFFGEIHEKTGL
ncbi:MAG: hypothetical protein FWF54_03630 [Candidatus Azobacteroides sp.]|nr:hypothetical protein [Candidatus Azobacteroides sp.]